jgi:PAS domain S-box-containing protein
MLINSAHNSILEGNNQLLKHAIDASLNSIFIIDPAKMQLVAANTRAVQLTGYTDDVLLSKALNHFLEVENTTLSHVFENVITTGFIQTLSLNGWIIHKNNNRYKVQFNLSGFEHNSEKYFVASASKSALLEKVQNELRFHSVLFNNISDAIVSTDENFIITSWNKEAEIIYGWTAEEAIGRATKEITGTEFPGSSSEEVRQQIYSNSKWRGEIVTRKKNGEKVPVLLSVSTFKDEAGKIKGTIAVAKDITDRKKLEEELYALNEQLEQRVASKTEELTSVFERITDAFVAFDKDWNYKYINRKAAEISGKQLNELLGKNLWEVFPDLPGTSTHTRLLATMKNQQSLRLQEYAKQLDRWLEISLYPSPEGLSMYLQDITEKKTTEIALHEREASYRLIFETAQEGIWKIDEDARVTLVNEYLARLLGYSRDEILGRSMFDFISPEIKELAQKLIENRKNGIAEQHEFTLLTKEGSEVFTQMQATPIIVDGTYTGAFAMVLDITNRKKAELKLAESERRFKTLFENNAAGIALLSDEGVVVDLSPAVEKILGYKREDILNTTRTDFVMPEGVERIFSTLSRIKENPGLIETIEYQVVAPAGAKRWIQSTYTNLLHDTSVNAIVVSFHNIDELKKAEIGLRQSEEKTKKALLLGKIGLWQLDLCTQQFALVRRNLQVNGSYTWRF